MKYRSLLRAIAILIVPVFVLSFVSRAEALGRGGGGRGGGFSREDAARGGGVLAESRAAFRAKVGQCNLCGPVEAGLENGANHSLVG